MSERFHDPDPEILAKKPPVARDILALFTTTTTADGTAGPLIPIPLNNDQKTLFGNWAVPEPGYFYIYGDKDSDKANPWASPRRPSVSQRRCCRC